jgi:hypothetical protein
MFNDHKLVNIIKYLWKTPPFLWFCAEAILNIWNLELYIHTSITSIWTSNANLEKLIEIILKVVECYMDGMSKKQIHVKFSFCVIIVCHFRRTSFSRLAALYNNNTAQETEVTTYAMKTDLIKRNIPNSLLQVLSNTLYVMSRMKGWLIQVLLICNSGW